MRRDAAFFILILFIFPFCQCFHPQKFIATRHDIKFLRRRQVLYDSTKNQRFSSSRFQESAPTRTALDQDLILTIHDTDYNLTDWGNAHPGGVNILRNFHKKNATEQFYATGHSEEAIRLLQSFQISQNKTENFQQTASEKNLVKRWKSKLVSHEDPYWIHKSLGIYSLCNFIFRFTTAMFGKDPSAGMGSNLGKGTNIFGIACLLPHILLSYSSLIFDTVPLERVVGKPMIWKENRWHSIVFGTRSIFSTFFCWLSIRFQHSQPWRSICVFGCCITVLMTMVGADIVTSKLQPAKTDSSVATLPFWEGCSVQTQSRIKHFYAYTQFVATCVCALAANPVWPLLMLFPIQFSSFLLTLCRKGLISAKGWHIGYATSLLLPFFLTLRVIIELKSVSFITGIIMIPALLFGLRSLRINKYKIWIPTLILRIAVGDKFIPFEKW